MDFIIQNINLFLVFTLIIQALLFAILFLRSDRNNPLRILGLYELSYFITYFLILFYLIDETRLFVFSYYFLIPLLATFPVLFYFFIRKLSRGSLSGTDLLHFIFPAILLIANIFIISPLSFDEKYSVIYKKSIMDSNSGYQEIFMFLNGMLYPLLLKIQPFIYILFCTKEILSVRKRISEEYSFSEAINLKWAIEFLVIFSVLFIFSFFLKSDTYNISFVLFVNLIIGIEGVHFSNRALMPIINLENLYEPSPVQDKKYMQSSLKEEDKTELYEKIIEYITARKLYLNPDLRLTDIAQGLSTNRQYISQAINERSGTNFYHFINQLRIKEFIQQCHTEQFRNKTIEGMGSMIGFKSKSSFFSEFKRVYGCTPKEYLKVNT